jgi:hypothetical protein
MVQERYCTRCFDSNGPGLSREEIEAVVKNAEQRVVLW